MPESSGGASRRSSRATWVALRTLHQVPKVVGETASRDPIFEVRSVRLVLSDEAMHFNRLMACSRCGRDVTGPPVRTAADLDQQPNPVICRECVKSASMPARVRRVPPAEPAPVVGLPSVIAVTANSTAVDPADQALGRLEGRIEELRELVEAQRVALAAAISTRPIGADAVEQRERMEEVDRARLRALEERVEDVLARLSQRADADRALLERVQAEGRAQLDSLEGAVLAAGTQSAAAAAGAADATAALARIEDERIRPLIGRLEAQQGDRLRRLETASAEANAALVSVDKQVNDRLDRRAEELARDTESLARRLSRLESEGLEAVRGLDDRFQRLEAAAAAADAELGRIDAQVNDRLERRAERVARDAEAVGGRLSALERQVTDAVAGLDERFEAQREESAAEVAKGFAEERATVEGARDGNTRRIQALEKALQGRERELSDLADLQGSLDAGLGELRAAIEALRSDTANLARAQEDLDARVRTLPEAVPSQPRGRIRGGAKADLAAVAGHTDNLARQQQAVQSRMAAVEDAVARAADAAKAASTLAGALAPLRSHVQVLDDELSAQHDAIEALRATVEQLGRTVAAAARPAAKRPAKTAAKVATKPAAKVATKPAAKKAPRASKS